MEGGGKERRGEETKSGRSPPLFIADLRPCHTHTHTHVSLSPSSISWCSEMTVMFRCYGEQGNCNGKFRKRCSNIAYGEQFFVELGRTDNHIHSFNLLSNSYMRNLIIVMMTLMMTMKKIIISNNRSLINRKNQRKKYTSSWIFLTFACGLLG